MIGYLKGEVAAVYDDSIVLEVMGIGYNIMMPLSAMSMLSREDKDVKIHTYLAVREDAMLLYGFITKDDLDLFKLLIQVNGVGPKVALALMTYLNSDDLRFAISAGDAKTISKAPGIGSKTAQRIIIDLKDKVIVDATFRELDASSEMATKDLNMSDARAEAVAALTALGYASKEAMAAVKKAEVSDDSDVEEILKVALRIMSKL